MWRRISWRSGPAPRQISNSNYSTVCPFPRPPLPQKFRSPRCLLWQCLNLRVLQFWMFGGKRSRDLFSTRSFGYVQPARQDRVRTYLALTVGFHPGERRPLRTQEGMGLFTICFCCLFLLIWRKGGYERPAWLLVSGSIWGVYFNSWFRKFNTSGNWIHNYHKLCLTLMGLDWGKSAFKRSQEHVIVHSAKSPW